MAYISTKDIKFTELLKQAITENGKLSECYSVFHDYSLLNTLKIIHQMMMYNIKPSPIKGYKAWEKLNRKPTATATRLEVLFPKFRYITKKNEETGKDETIKYLHGYELNRVHVAMSETEVINAEKEQEKQEQEKNIFHIDIKKLAKSFDIKLIDFDEINGNCQGYAKPKEKEIALNPVAKNMTKTFIHELAHVLLHADEEGYAIVRNIKEAEAETTCYIVLSICNEQADMSESRGYIQHWLKDDTINEKTAKRIFKCSDTILKAIKEQAKA